MAKSKRARKAQKAQQRNAKQRQTQQFLQVQQSNKNKQVQELRTKYQRVIEQNKPAKTAGAKAAVTKAGTDVAKKAEVTKKASLRSLSEPRILEKTEIQPTAEKTANRVRMAEKPEAPMKSEKVPTLEDWQAKQRKRVEEAYERKQEELKLKEVELELQAEPKKKIGRKILAICAVLLLLVNLGIGGWIVAQKFLPREEVDVPNVGAEIKKAEVDFGQKILAEDGSDFVPIYRLGEAKNIVMKLPNLKCTTNCENIKDVMLDDYFLSKNEHSVLNVDGMATIILDGSFLESLAPNEYTLTFEVENEGEVKLIGVVLTIEKVELVCEEGQVLQGESCVDEKGNEVAKPTERVIKHTENATVGGAVQNSGKNDNQTSEEKPTEPSKPAEPEVPEKSPEQIACERKIGPTSLTIVHWLSEEEKAEHPNAEVYVVRGGFSANPQTGAAQMSWVDGACRPAVNQSGFAGNGSYISSYRAQAVYGGEVARVITENPGQDAVVWGLKYGGVKTEMMTDARVVLKY